MKNKRCKCENKIGEQHFSNAFGFFRKREKVKEKVTENKGEKRVKK